MDKPTKVPPSRDGFSFLLGVAYTVLVWLNVNFSMAVNQTEFYIYLSGNEWFVIVAGLGLMIFTIGLVLWGIIKGAQE